MAKKDAKLKALEAELKERKAALPHDQQVLLTAAANTFDQALKLGAMMDKDGRHILMAYITARIELTGKKGD